MDYETERAAALEQDAMNKEEWTSMAVRQYADVYGAADTTREWVLTPFDTWEPNPSYRGPRGPHPEDDSFWEMSEAEQAAHIAWLNAPKPPPAPRAPETDEIPF